MNASDYIALAASIIAMSALGVSIWQGYLARRHNILSTKPVLHFDRNHVDNWRVSIFNGGLGPAIITRFAVSIYGQNYVNPNEDIYLNYIQRICNDLGVENINYTFTIPSRNSSIILGETLLVFEIKDLTKGQIKFIESLIKFDVSYTSIYGNKEFVLNSTI